VTIDQARLDRPVRKQRAGAHAGQRRDVDYRPAARTRGTGRRRAGRPGRRSSTGPSSVPRAASCAAAHRTAHPLQPRPHRRTRRPHRANPQSSRRPRQAPVRGPRRCRWRDRSPRPPLQISRSERQPPFAGLPCSARSTRWSGNWKPPSLPRQSACSSSSVSVAQVRSTTNVATRSLYCASGRPTAAASSACGSWNGTRSTSLEAMFSPPLAIITCLRSVRDTNPSASTWPASPMRNQPPA